MTLDATIFPNKERMSRLIKENPAIAFQAILISKVKDQHRRFALTSEKEMHFQQAVLILQRTREEHDQLAVSDEEVEPVENPGRMIVKAVGLMLVGAAIPAAFADPLVDAIYSLSKATHVSSFFVSFVVLPLVNNSSEVVSAVRSMRKKRRRSASLALSEVYCVVTVNNLMCLGMFLALVYARDITWDFSSELLIILLVCVVMGLFTSFRTNFPLWTCLVAYSLYPLSLVLVHILDSVFHWS
uniref:Sodium/calcium exchanger membrane region domain-containing protein n=1 Tax=Aegilops tauschii TaxID=37682 RepID=M8CH96_AEGTA